MQLGDWIWLLAAVAVSGVVVLMVVGVVLVANRRLLENLSNLSNLSIGCCLEGDEISDLLLTTMLANWQTAVFVRYGSDSTEDLFSGLAFVSAACQ